mmetsp:Transcript_10681/g.25899  ORF Transcript_10681/g.25899 Transcript_10681/m.25899 type:complete len:262 (+) Transcript_10681:51-836(+)
MHHNRIHHQPHPASCMSEKKLHSYCSQSQAERRPLSTHSAQYTCLSVSQSAVASLHENSDVGGQGHCHNHTGHAYHQHIADVAAEKCSCPCLFLQRHRPVAACVLGSGQCISVSHDEVEEGRQEVGHQHGGGATRDAKCILEVGNLHCTCRSEEDNECAQPHVLMEGQGAGLVGPKQHVRQRLAGTHAREWVAEYRGHCHEQPHDVQPLAVLAVVVQQVRLDLSAEGHVAGDGGAEIHDKDKPIGQPGHCPHGLDGGLPQL